MVSPRENHPENFEQRLDHLREEALAKGAITGEAIRPVGGPIPPLPPNENVGRPGYYGLPLLKPPVWKWMIDVYFFIGGLAGMSGLIAAAALLKHDWALSRAAIWAAGVGAIISTILLVWDLGRPMRFIAMLRVFKFHSPMSLGSWILAAFSAASVLGVIFTEWHLHALANGAPMAAVHVLAILALLGSGCTGIFLATYTGALLGATAIPAWHLHRGLLPFKFGVAGLGSAAGLLEVLGYDRPALRAIGWVAAAMETLVLLRLETNKHGEADEVLHHGGSGWTLRIGECLEGPVALIIRALGGAPIAGASFMLGSLLTRFGWVAAGRRNARNPAAVFASQGAAAGGNGNHP